MADRTINREAWAALLAELIKTESRNKKAAFARLAGVDPKSINLWLARAVDVSEESVRRVARAVGRSPIDMLVQVGYYSAAEVEQAPAAPVSPENDPALKVILETDLPPRVKQRMIQRLKDLRAAQQEREVEEVRWWIDQTREV